MLTYPKYNIKIKKKPNGTMILKSDLKLEKVAKNYGSKFIEISNKFPNNIWLAEKLQNKWNKITYGEALKKIQSISQSFLDLGLNQEKGIMILSANSIKNALVSVAAICSGIPVSPISVSYSTISKDFLKLKHCFNTIQPGLIFAEEKELFINAINNIRQRDTFLLFGNKVKEERNIYSFDSFNNNIVTSSEIEIYMKSIPSKYVAKYLFTSGSTGMPKAVINTHEMLCTNIQQANQVLPKEYFLSPRVLIDWLPWNHTMGGNHIFNMILWTAGTLFIDNGKPIQGKFEETIKNLKEVSPSSYISVPAGLSMLLTHLKSDKVLRDSFFKNLLSIHYGGASLPKEVWYGIRDLAQKYYNKEIYLACGWGSTETAPVATSTYFNLQEPGNIGLPLPGVELKLVPNGKKLELRVKGPNVTPGYLNRPDLTKKSFDEEGFYMIGDAGKLVDNKDPSKGIYFDGRVAENFKLLSGTWVDVGTLRLQTIDSCSPLIQDLVVTGHDKSYVGALVWLNIPSCNHYLKSKQMLSLKELVQNSFILENIIKKLKIHNSKNKSSSLSIKKIILLSSLPDFDDNEITDKGYVNQSATLTSRKNLVDRIYDKENYIEVINIT